MQFPYYLLVVVPEIPMPVWARILWGIITPFSTLMVVYMSVKSLDLSALTGGAQTGFTSPTYDSTLATAPSSNGVLWIVSAKGGTQANVRMHTISDPFSLLVQIPSQYKVLPNANPVTGVRGAIPRNTLFLKLTKGVQIAANYSPVPMVIRITADIPAGSDAYDAANIRAAWSYLIGALTDVCAGLGDTSVDGVL